MWLRKRVEPQFRHREVLRIVGREEQTIADRDGRDSEVGQGQREPFLTPFPVEFAGVLGNLWSHRMEFQAPEKLFSPLGLVGTHSHVDLGDVDRATREQNSFGDHSLEQLVATVAVVNCVDDNGAVQQAGRSHLLRFAVVLDLLEALYGFLADVPNPLGRSFGQFRMVFLCPGSLCSA